MRKIRMQTSNMITLEELFKNFVTKCKVRNLSEYTIKSYENNFRVFTCWINKEVLAEELTLGDIDNWILYMREERGINDVSIRSHVRGVRAILYYGMEMNYIRNFKIQLPKEDKQVKETYTDAEVALLLKKPDIKKCTFVEYRMWVYSNFLLATGMRLSSAINITIGDLDFDSEVICIRKSKNRKQQIIPMSHTLNGILKEYISVRGGEAAEDYLFCTEYGTKASTKCIQDSLVRYNKARGVMKTSSHLYRHTFAKQWILNGGDIFRLQKILGHSDLTVVKEYVNMFSNDLGKDFERFNPLDNMVVAKSKKMGM